LCGKYICIGVILECAELPQLVFMVGLLANFETIDLSAVNYSYPNRIAPYYGFGGHCPPYLMMTKIDRRQSTNIETIPTMTGYHG
jgi:hypothetical protein